MFSCCPRRPAEDEDLLEHKRLLHQKRVLLLGPAESGKSTLFKQVKILFNQGFSPWELENQVQIIRANIAIILQRLLQVMIKSKTFLSNEELNSKFYEIVEYSSSSDMNSTMMASPDMLSFFNDLMKENLIQTLLQRSCGLNLPESAEYFLSNYSRIYSDGYTPTDQDILHARHQTTGVIETYCEYEGSVIVYIDVGGQKSERRKWFYQFEGVKMVLFVTSLIDYDLFLEEDKNIKRVDDSLALFKYICNCRWFSNSGIMLFMNKVDLFEKKLKWTPLRSSYPEYEGGENLEKGKRFFKKMYLSTIDDPNRHVYVHFTCATNSNTCRTVLTDIHHMIVKEGLSKMGMF